MRRFWRSGDSKSKRVLDVLEFFLSETVEDCGRCEMFHYFGIRKLWTLTQNCRTREKSWKIMKNNKIHGKRQTVQKPEN